MTFQQFEQYMFVGLLAYLVFCVSDLVVQLYDRYVRKKKVCRMELDVADYVKLKNIVKHGDTGLSVDKWLQFHFKEDIKEYLEGIE